MFTRRLDLAPSGITHCSGGHGCPAILEMDSGDFAVIGADITDQAAGNLLPGTGCASGERVVRVPRHVLVLARPAIPSVA